MKIIKLFRELIFYYIIGLAWFVSIGLFVGDKAFSVLCIVIGNLLILLALIYEKGKFFKIVNNYVYCYSWFKISDKIELEKIKSIDIVRGSLIITSNLGQSKVFLNILGNFKKFDLPFILELQKLSNKKITFIMPFISNNSKKTIEKAFINKVKSVQ